MAEPVPAWDRTTRVAWAARLQAARATLVGAGRGLVQARRLDDVVVVEGAIMRLGRLVDQIETGACQMGRWVRGANDAAPAALAPLDAALTEGIRELALTAASLVAELTPARLAAVEHLLREIETAYAARQAALVAEDPPTQRPVTLVDLAPGARVTVEGRPYAVTARTRWRRGDASLSLADPVAALELWQDPEAGLALFERQDAPALMPDQASLTLDGTEFGLRWRDAGGGAVSDATGRAWRAGPRWMYASPEGVLLWLEQEAGALRLSRGLPLGEDDFQRA